MSSKNALPNQLDDEIYESVKVKGIRVAIAGVFILGVSFLLHFPFQDTLKTLAINALNSQSSCPIQYEKIETSLFFPKIILTKPVFSGICFRNPRSFLKFEKMQAGLHSPSLSPLGIRLYAEINQGKTKIKAYPVVSFNKVAVKIEETDIDGESLGRINPNLKTIAGLFNIEALLKSEGKFLNSAIILLKSTTFRVLGQKIMNFDIPSMTIGKLFFKANLSKKTNLQIQSLEIGGDAAPLSAKFKGKIKLNQVTPARSKVDLTGEVKFSDEFMEKFPILNIFFGGKKKDEQGYYQMQLSGTLGQMNPPRIQ